ncbi:MAG: DMT family transporter [Chloroflexi bacterium]|nr:DMT family transporter [Chloroflexota bacterium]
MNYTLGLLFAFGYTVTFAATSVGMRSLSRRLEPFLVVAIRAIVGLMVMVPLALIVGRDQFHLLTPERLLYLCGSVALGGVLGSACNVYALKIMGVGRAFPITNANPLFTVLFAYLLLGERIEPIMIPGTLLVIAGVYLISRPRRHSVATIGEPPLTLQQILLGTSMALAAALFWGLNAVILAPGLKGINPIVANSVRVPTVAVLSSAIAALRGEWDAVRGLNRRQVLIFLFIGTVGYAGTSTLYVASVQHIGPSLSAVIGTTAPLFALPLSMALLGERPTRATLLGTLLTIAGILLVI